MKNFILFFNLTLLLLVPALVSGQVPDTSFRATVNVIEYSSSPVNNADWRITFQANDLRGEPDLADLKPGALLFDANCMVLRLVQVSVAGSGPSATIRGEFADASSLGNFPSYGEGAILNPGDNGLVGIVQEGNERINTCITWYNTVQDLGGGRVDTISTLADTANVFMPPRSGDVVIKSDTSFIGHYTGERWIISYFNSGGGSSGPVSWNDLTNVPAGFADGTDDGLTEVTSDPTLTGTGTIGDPMAVNTSLIATRTWTETELDNRIEVELQFRPTSQASSVSLPFTPDPRYPIRVFRNAAFNTVSKTTPNGSDWSLSGSTLTSTRRAVDPDEQVIIFFTKLQ